MVRAPCCEKMGLKKGPWSPEEDETLINFIKMHGHSNWRALPKQAGLLRCGKSCRLRWTNYLRPDIKRGNFTREEEDTIIKLHDLLGNRWSAIAARLPGRTDNEIKNVWHTHLKKKVNNNNKEKHMEKTKQKNMVNSTRLFPQDQDIQKEQGPVKYASRYHVRSEAPQSVPPSPERSSTDMPTTTIILRDINAENSRSNSSGSESNYHSGISMNNDYIPSPTEFPQVDDNFWSEVLSADNNGDGDDPQFQIPLSPLTSRKSVNGYNSILCDTSMDLWFDTLFTQAEELQELLEI